MKLKLYRKFLESKVINHPSKEEITNLLVDLIDYYDVSILRVDNYLNMDDIGFEVQVKTTGGTTEGGAPIERFLGLDEVSDTLITFFTYLEEKFDNFSFCFKYQTYPKDKEGNFNDYLIKYDWETIDKSEFYDFISNVDSSRKFFTKFFIIKMAFD